MFRFLKTLWAACKFFGYLALINKYLVRAKKLEHEGKITERDKLVFEKVHGWGKLVVKLSKATVEVIGAENLPAGPVVFVGNHQGYFDIPVLLGYVEKPMAFMAKIELLKVPLLSGWMKLMQCTFLNRKNPRQSIAAMLEAIESVKKGYSLVIFPEGHRSFGGPVAEFKTGSFKLAYKAGVPIVPVTIDGTWRLFEEKKGLNTGHVKVTIHAPVATAGLSKDEQLELPAKVRDRIASVLVPVAP